MFRLKLEGFIRVVEYRASEHGPHSFDARPVLEDGECRFGVGDERLKLSEVSQRALQPLFFPPPSAPSA